MDRRIKLLRISTPLLVDIFKGMDGKTLINCEGMPKDAKVVGVSTNVINQNRVEHGTVYIWVESESFEEIDNGDIYPDLQLTFSKTYNEGVS